MGIIYTHQPQFLISDETEDKLRKTMFIKRNGKAVHKLGDLSRDLYDAELICISNEDDENWIGNYAEGFGFFDVKFSKKDCRDATEEEVQEWIKDKNTFKF